MCDKYYTVDELFHLMRVKVIKPLAKKGVDRKVLKTDLPVYLRHYDRHGRVYPYPILEVSVRNNMVFFTVKTSDGTEEWMYHPSLYEVSDIDRLSSIIKKS